MSAPAIPAASQAFQPAIEGLRAVAILLVILFHIGVPVVSGGFIGVDVFFVISGFLITGFIVAARESDQPASLTDFYARRVRRLLPAGLVLLIACAVANLALAPDQPTNLDHSTDVIRSEACTFRPAPGRLRRGGRRSGWSRDAIGLKRRLELSA